MIKLLYFAAILAATTLPVQAHSFKVGAIDLEHPMIQEAPPSAPVLAGYVMISNNGSEDDRLIAIESSATRNVQLHTSVVSDGIARMNPMTDGLIIPAGDIVWLGDNGTHAMFNGPDRPYRDGDEIPAVLVFEKAGRIDVTFKVEKVAKDELMPGHAGMDMGGTEAGPDAAQ